MERGGLGNVNTIEYHVTSGNVSRQRGSGVENPRQGVGILKPNSTPVTGSYCAKVGLVILAGDTFRK